MHEPNDETFELSRVDAVSLEQLTKSKFTINIYGFCGTSSFQEFASGDLKSLLPKLEPKEKLKMAMWVAEGVADVHAVDHVKSTAEDKNTTWVPKLIHNDINMDNVLLGRRDGIEVPLLNDYNIAVFRKKDAKTEQPCPFRGRFANPQVSFYFIARYEASTCSLNTIFYTVHCSGCHLVCSFDSYGITHLPVY